PGTGALGPGVQLRLGVGELRLELRQARVAQLAGEVEVRRTLGVLDLVADLVDLPLDVADLAQLGLLVVPPGPKLIAMSAGGREGCRSGLRRSARRRTPAGSGVPKRRPSRCTCGTRRASSRQRSAARPGRASA